MNEYMELLDESAIDKLEKYNSRIVELKYDFQRLEDSTFDGMDDTKKIYLEISKVRNTLYDDIGKFFEYFELYNELAHDYSIIKVAPEKIVELKKKINYIELSIDLPIRLFSVIPKMVEEVEERKNKKWHRETR